jgi:hypothetical protein
MTSGEAADTNGASGIASAKPAPISVPATKAAAKSLFMNGLR